MNRREAVECLSRIKAGLDGVRNNVEGIKADLLELQEREGWRALGYANWRACASAEFNRSQSQVYRLLSSAKVEKQISHGAKKECDAEPIPERVTRPLTHVPVEVRPEIFQAAQAAAGGKRPTEEHVRREVERFQDKQKSPSELIEEIEEEEAEEEDRLKIHDFKEALARWSATTAKVVRQMEASDPKPGTTTLRLGREFLEQLEREVKKWEKRT
ncbi:MAG: hypothetical protein KGL39_08135 [Patescibacteria group bacterium]|nr:hypothetical protein [Patescibacteria group bacterium]